MNLSVAVSGMSLVASPPGPPQLYAKLFDSFEQAGLAWCNWKSPRRLTEAFAGRADLDLLIARSDRQEATRILTSCGFKHAPDAPGRDDPAMMSFFGFDKNSGALLHVHTHFRLILGPPLFKNFRLPCEGAFLARSRLLPGGKLRVLGVEDAALLLFIRAQLEFSRFDPVLLRRRREVIEKFRHDFEELRLDFDVGEFRQAASQIFDAGLTERIVLAIDAGDPMAAPAGLRRKIARALAQNRFYGGLEASFRSLARAAIFLLGAFNRRYLRTPRIWGRRAPGGGVVIAFVGVDGSGKSTAAQNICDWLGPEIDVLKVYFGTGDGAPSLLLAPFKAIAGLVTRFIRTKPKGASHGHISDRPPGPVYSSLFAIWAVAVALDKRHKLILIQRAVRRGFVVVTDRYLQSEIENFNDGPLLHRLPLAPRWLRRFEEGVYTRARRAPPDLVIKLHVGPETVARREPEMNPALIDERIASVGRLRFQGARIVDVDARMPLDEVARVVKGAVWSVL